jgi:hypothetical protein
MNIKARTAKDYCNQVNEELNMRKRNFQYNIEELFSPFAAFLLLVVLGVLTVTAQQRQPARGFQFANSYATNGFDAVNVSNGNLIVNLPIASLPAGRGTSPGFTVTLQYNSKLWDSKQTTFTDAIQPGNQDQPPAPTYSYTSDVLEQSERGGWKMLTSYRLIETDRLSLEQNPNPCVLGQPVEKLRARWKMEVEFPDGSVKQFIPTYHSSSTLDGYYNVNSNGRSYWASTQTHPGNGLCYVVLSENQATTAGMHFITTDGSRLRLFVPYQSSNWKIYSSEGTVVENSPPDDNTVAQRVTDRNGSKIEIKGNQIVWGGPKRWDTRVA